MIFLRSALFYVGLILATLIFFPLSVLIMPLAFRVRFRIVSKWAVFNLWWLEVSCGLSCEVEGLENVPQQAAIIMCKHQSAWETLAVQQFLPPQVWILKRELLWIPIYGWGLASMNPIAIARSAGVRALRQIVNHGCERLARGLWVVIYPEGTRVAPGDKGKYQPGGGMLALKSQCPILPVAHNAGHFWPKNSFRKWPGTIKMVIGPVIEPGAKSAADITREVESWIEATVAGLPVPTKR